MQFKPQSVRSLTIAEISRRGALKGAASLAAIAASSVTLGHLVSAQAPAASNPYAARRQHWAIEPDLCQPSARQHPCPERLTSCPRHPAGPALRS